MHTKWIAAAAAICLLVAFFMGSFYAPAAADGPVAGKGDSWEYRVKVFDTSADPKAIDQALNQLGEQGWELAGVLNIDQPRRETSVVFKRPKK